MDRRLPRAPRRDGRVPARPAGRSGDTVVGHLRRAARRPAVLLIGHMDTVFDPGTAAARPFRDRGRRRPRAGRHRHEVRAPGGALRPQGARSASVAALPFERLVFVANPDEEIGSPTSTPHIRALAADADVALVLECARANGDIVSSRKGIVDTRLHVQGRAAHAGRRTGEGPQRDPRGRPARRSTCTRSTAAGRA